MNFLALIPLRAWLAAGLALVLFVAVGWFGAHERNVGRAQVTALWNADKAQREAERARQAAAAQAQAEANAQETQRRLERQKEAQDESDAQLARARADAARAHDALDGLRQRAAQLAAAARRPAGDPAAGELRAAAGTPAGMLADVLGQLGGRAELLAAYADAARRAGLQCARDYDALSQFRPTAGRTRQ